MRFFVSCLSWLVFCVVYWQVSAGDSTNVTQRPKRPKENEKHKLPIAHSPEFVSVKKLVPRNLTSLKNVSSGFAARSNKTTGDSKLDPESDKNLQVENGSFDPFKPLFLFPILPFLFPPKDEGFISPEENEPGVKNDTRTLSKTFTFFDFAFPLNERANDSKIINVKKLTVDKAGSKKKNRKRRNAKRAVPDFIEDAPMFPDSELDEFLPKPDLFFPDLSFHPKPVKLSRRKRDEKKPDVKKDFKLLLNAFDEAFTRTEKELEQVDPILNFIKGMESSFGEEKKGGDDFFKDLSEGQDNSNAKWKVQRNVREHPDGLTKNPDTPMIIVNKVVKIGEFRCRNDKLDANKSKRKKKESDLKLKFLGGGGKNEETTEKNIFDRFQQEQPHETKLWKRSHHGNPKGRRHIHASLKSNDIKILPRNVSNGRNLTEENGKTEKSLKVDLLKAESEGREAVKRETSEEKRGGRKASYDDLKKNITEVLKKFLKRSDEAESSEERGRGLQEEEEEEEGAFDWTEKEILDSQGIRRKKEVEFPLEYTDTKKKERQVAELNFLFLTVTLPTVLGFTLMLLVCFFNLRAKGKICTKLFKPRNVYVTEEDVHPPSKAPTTEAKAQES